MKVEQAKQIASNTIEQLRQALEAGHSGALKEYLCKRRSETRPRHAVRAGDAAEGK